MADIIQLKKNGAKLIPGVHEILYSAWERVHGKKLANLNVSNEAFFTEKIDRVIPHDALHELFRYGSEPKYKILKKDPNKALISKSMFFEQSHEEQLNTVREEMMVLAAERYLIPGVTTSPGLAIRQALKLLITSASKGWFPLFIVDNYLQIVDTALPETLKNIKEIANA